MPHCSPTPPFAGSPLLSDWHKVPDCEPSHADLAAAVSAITGGSVPIKAAFASFEAPPPAAPATSADWDDAVQAIGHALAPPADVDSSAPISGWSPSPAPPGPTEPRPALRSAASPPTAPPSAHSLESSPAPPEDKSDVQLARDLLVLESAYPTVHSDILLTVLEKKESMAAALSWLSTIREIESLATAMQDVFPSAPSKQITTLVQVFGGELSSVWSVLSKSYDSPWTSNFTSSAIQRKLSRSALLPDSDEELSDVLVASDPLKKFDAVWWQEYITSRRYRLGSRSDFLPIWDSICAVAAACSPLPPCFVVLVSLLGRCSSDRASFVDAVKILRVLPPFHDALAVLNKTHKALDLICRILIADGLITPVAALWLALNSLSPCEDLFRKFPKAHISVCKAHNKAVRVQLSIPESLTTAEPLFIGSSDEGNSDVNVDVEVVPDPRPKKSRAGGSRWSLRGSELSDTKRPKHTSKSESAASATFSSCQKNPVHESKIPSSSPAKRKASTKRSKIKAKAGLALSDTDHSPHDSFPDPPV